MSRRSATSRSLRRRPSRVVPAGIVAVVMLVLGALTVTAAGARLAQGAWPAQVTRAAAPVASLTWGSSALVATSAVVAVLGLLLLVAGIKRGPFRTTRLQAPEGGQVPETEYVISTRALTRLAAARADGVDGVERVEQVTTSGSARRLHVRVRTTSEQSAAIRDRVQQEVGDELASAGLSPAPRVTATVRTKEI